MTKKISTPALMVMAAPVIKMVIKKISELSITEENLLAARQQLHDWASKVVGWIPTEIDDYFLQALEDTLKAQRDNVKELIDDALDPLEAFIESPYFVYDDFLLPFFKQFRQVAGIPDNDE